MYVYIYIYAYIHTYIHIYVCIYINIIYIAAGAVAATREGTAAIYTYI